MNNKRIFHDPIHKEIVFDSGKPEELMIMELVIRLLFKDKKNKTIRWASYYSMEQNRQIYPLNWRFCIARKIYAKLIETESSFCENKFILYGAALLHDLGHGPLSHTSEALFDHNHEQWSKNLVENYYPINSILKKYDNELPKQIGRLFESKQIFQNL